MLIQHFYKSFFNIVYFGDDYKEASKKMLGQQFLESATKETIWPLQKCRMGTFELNWIASMVIFYRTNDKSF